MVNAARRAETATHEATNLSKLATLKAVVDAAEVTTLEMPAGATRITEIAKLKATCLADLAPLEVAEIGGFMTLEATRRDDLTTLEATCLAEIAALQK